MSTSSIKIHPLLATASGAVILVSLLGAAALLGWLPGSRSHDAPAAATVAPVAVPNAGKPAQVAAQSPTPANKTAADARMQERAHLPAASTAASKAAAPCAVCGKVIGVHAIEAEAKPSGVGVVAGAVVGGLLGNQVGGGSGKTLATVAGAVGGGYAGNEIEKRTRKAVAYEAEVQMETGERQTFRFDTQPPWKTGDRVRVADGALVAR